MDTVKADIVDRVEDHTVDMDAVVIIEVEDVVLFPRRHSMVQFLRPVVESPHSLEVVFQVWE